LDYTNSPNVANHILERLDTFPLLDIDLFLLQLCYLGITKKEIQNFIIKKSITNSNIALRAICFLDSWSQDNKAYSDNAKEFLHALKAKVEGTDHHYKR
jgi:hypothetical protein